MEAGFFTPKCFGIFLSIGKFAKALYLHIPWFWRKKRLRRTIMFRLVRHRGHWCFGICTWTGIWREGIELHYSNRFELVFKRK